jgi:serine protease Do
MSTLLRLGSIATLGSLLAAPSFAAVGQWMSPMQDSPAYLFHSSQGYLGVTINDVSNDDVSAGKAGLKVNDVIVEMNGQTIESIEQLRRMLRETPSGRTVTLVISRDGSLINMSLQLADKDTVGRKAWGDHTPVPVPIPSSGLLASPGSLGSTGFTDIFPDTFPGRVSGLYVGAVVNPVTPQLAGYFGVKSGVGLLVASVANKSPASAAGLKAGDVVMKINQDTVATRADWERVLRASDNQPVQLTVVREKKEISLTLRTSSTRKDKKKSLLLVPDSVPSTSEVAAMIASAGELASLDPRVLQQEMLLTMRQMEEMRQRMGSMLTQQDPEILTPLLADPPSDPPTPEPMD